MLGDEQTLDWLPTVCTESYWAVSQDFDASKVTSTLLQALDFASPGNVKHNYAAVLVEMMIPVFPLTVCGFSSLLRFSSALDVCKMVLVEILTHTRPFHRQTHQPNIKRK